MKELISGLGILIGIGLIALGIYGYILHENDKPEENVGDKLDVIPPNDDNPENNNPEDQQDGSLLSNVAKRTAEASVKGFADAINQARVTYIFDNLTEPTASDINLDTIVVNGEKPTNCNLTFINDVVELTGCIVATYSSEKTCSYQNGIATCE